MSIAAGIVLWKNFLVYTPEGKWQPYWRGWPFRAFVWGYKAVLTWTSPAKFTIEKWNPWARWEPFGLVLDMLVGVSIVALVAFIAEWNIRLRRALKR